MAQQTVNIGSSANKGDGDPLRTAFTKINENFTEVYTDIAALADGNVVTDVKGNVFAEDSTLLVDAINGTIPAANLSGALPALDGSALTGITASSIAFADITGTPTTIAGYGIADAATSAQGALADTAIQPGDTFVGDLKGSVFADDSTLLVDGVNGTIPAANITGSLSGVSVSTTDITGYGTFTGTEESFATLTGATGTVAHDCDNGHIFYHTTPAADWTANFTNLDLSADRATTLALVVEQGGTAYIPNAIEIEGVSQTILWQDGSVPSGNANGTDVISFSILNRDDSTTYVVMGQLVGFS